MRDVRLLCKTTTFMYLEFTLQHPRQNPKSTVKAQFLSYLLGNFSSYHM